MTVTAELPARLLAGRYEITGNLGIGGTCVVDEAVDRRTGTKVAIKRLRPELAEETAWRRRLARERDLLRSLAHPRIVGYLGFGLWPEPYLVIDRIAGKTLTASKGDWPTCRVAEAGRQICEALETVHRAEIVHRDIKPLNLMDTVGGLVLIDFSIAKPIGERQDRLELSQTCDVIGSAAFLSPEQVRGEQVDGRSDLFSLGTVLYLLASGCLPFGAETVQATAYSIVKTEPQPLEELRPDLGPLGSIIRRAMEKLPSMRFQSAAEMAAALATVPGPRPAFD